MKRANQKTPARFKSFFGDLSLYESKISRDVCTDPTRAQSGILVTAETTKILVDMGIGVFRTLTSKDLKEIKAVLLTHNHLDHNGDLLALLKARWLLEAEELQIYGPSDTKSVMEKLLEIYPYLEGNVKYRIRSHKEFKINHFHVKAVKTNHGNVESRGYVIKDLNKTLTISGDTVPVKEIVEVESDLLVHELSFSFGKETYGHTAPENFAEMLPCCKAKRIGFVHLYEDAFKDAHKIIEYFKNIKKDIDYFIAEDGMEIKL